MHYLLSTIYTLDISLDIVDTWIAKLSFVFQYLNVQWRPRTRSVVVSTITGGIRSSKCSVEQIVLALPHWLGYFFLYRNVFPRIQSTSWGQSQWFNHFSIPSANTVPWIRQVLPKWLLNWVEIIPKQKTRKLDRIKIIRWWRAPWLPLTMPDAPALLVTCWVNAAHDHTCRTSGVSPFLTCKWGWMELGKN